MYIRKLDIRCSSKHEHRWDLILLSSETIWEGFFFSKTAIQTGTVKTPQLLESVVCIGIISIVGLWVENVNKLRSTVLIMSSAASYIKYRTLSQYQWMHFPCVLQPNDIRSSELSVNLLAISLLMVCTAAKWTVSLSRCW